MLDYPDELAEAQDAMQYAKYDNRARQSSLNLDDEDELERITTDMGNPSVYKFPQWFLNRQRDNSLEKDEQFLCSWAPQEGRWPQGDSESNEDRVRRSNYYYYYY